MAFRISRVVCILGRPVALGVGRWGSRQLHSASERSVWYAFLMLGILPSECLRPPFQTVSRRSSQNPLTGNSVNKGSLLQVVAERELRLRVRLLVHLEGERAGLFCYLFPLVVVAALPVGLHPHPVHPIEARRGSSGYGQC